MTAFSGTTAGQVATEIAPVPGAGRSAGPDPRDADRGVPEKTPTSSDHHHADLVLTAPGSLGTFNRAGVLGAADVHVAMRLARLAAEAEEQVLLAAALAVRAPRVGHVYVDLATVRQTAADEDDELELETLPWPEPRGWAELLARSPLVAVGEDGPADRPLRLIGTALYLDRFWRDERSVAADLLSRAGSDSPGVDEARLASGADRLFPDRAAVEPRWAAATAVLRRLTVIAGGPGTGKTTTIGRIVALVEEQAAASGRRPPLIGLVAPTGKAAARLEHAVHEEALRMDVEPAVRRRLLSTRASTVHRLLGARPDSASRFRHHRHQRLPHDVIVVDESSMVALSLMARLLEAVRIDARVILVGDPEQLASVEAGAVLGDIVGAALAGPLTTAPARSQLERITGTAPPASSVVSRARIADSIVVLRANYRFTGPLADLAEAIRTGAAERVERLLSEGEPALRWIELADDEDAAATMTRLDPIRAAITATGTALLGAATERDGEAALDALAGFRVLCAHRRGPYGVAAWTQWIEAWLSSSLPGFTSAGTWYLGRPVMVTVNDYGLRLFNGDTGAVVARADGGVTVAFRRGGSVVSISPARLASVETVFAMTVHKAQGSEFRRVAVVLPPSSSASLTRQLLYTAVTRAQEGLVLVGSAQSVRAAVARPVARASGLTRRLWDEPPPRGLEAP